MKKKNSNEELHSRREFFKKAAKTALPFIAGLALASNPIVAKAVEEAPMGCGYSCSGACKGSCGRACSFGCTNSCSGTCAGGCKGYCQGSCKGSCSGGCSGYSW